MDRFIIQINSDENKLGAVVATFQCIIVTAFNQKLVPGAHSTDVLNTVVQHIKNVTTVLSMSLLTSTSWMCRTFITWRNKQSSSPLTISSGQSVTDPPALPTLSALPAMNPKPAPLQPAVIGSQPNSMHFQKSAAPKSITIINS